MAFWSGESLKERLRSLEIISEQDYSAERVDCAAYTLRVGGEVYISPSESETDPNKVTIEKLGIAESFSIPPGQFAFIITEEFLSIPTNVLGFISMKSSIKLRGLVNVSGFHVDPGYKGKLIFAVFNAGPRPIHLKRREPCFLLWLSNLDNLDTQMFRTKAGFDDIPTEAVTKISGAMLSFEGLNAKINETKKEYGSKISSIEKEQAVIRALAILIIGILATAFLQPLLTSVRQGPPPAISAPAQSPKAP